MILAEYLAANELAKALPADECKAELRRIKSARQRALDHVRREADPDWWRTRLARDVRPRRKVYRASVPAPAPIRTYLPPFRPDLISIDDHARDGRVKMVADMHGTRCISAVFIAGIWVFPTCAAHRGFEPEYYLP